MSAPRQASLDFLQGVENQLQAQLGFGLARFDHREYLDAPISEGFVRFPPGAPWGEKGVPFILVVSADQASDQCCPFSYLRWRLGLTFENFPDPSHLSNNSSLNACVASGFHGVLRLSIAIYNLRYGPRNSGQFMREMEDAGANAAASLGSSDQLVKFFWPGICEDQRLQGELETSPLACGEWLAGLSASRTCSRKGPQSGTSRWYSWIHAANFWDRHWTETLFCGTFVAIASGWAKNWADIFTGGPPRHSSSY